MVEYIVRSVDYNGVASQEVNGELVRCRDCKHYYYADNRIPQEQRYVCDISGEKWKPDDFCSYAERRTDETTI